MIDKDGLNSIEWAYRRKKYATPLARSIGIVVAWIALANG
mgnify:FL=1